MAGLLNTFANNILLSNLVKIRWIAIFGQLCAILFVFFYLNIQIPITACLLVVFVSIFVNTFSFVVKKTSHYLSDKEAFYFLLFDTTQLAILLYLTGGIYNPFSLLLIAPLIISASYLPIVYSVILSSLSVLVVLLISFFYIEINWSENFNVPYLFTFSLALSLIISLIFITIYVYMFANSSRGISKALNQAKAALDNQEKLLEVGSLSAAAVHELSTPLNTIFLILDDLLKDQSLSSNIKINQEIQLLKSQAERCKEILLRLSKNPQKIKDDFLDKTTISNIIRMNFDKFNYRNIKFDINISSTDKEPIINLHNEIIYGIGNIIQNAIQHAKDVVQAELFWDHEIVKMKFIDNGLGFSKNVLENIGKPFISEKKETGMGLGIFISKNLIEKNNGVINFSNKINSSGSLVEIQLNRRIIEA